LQIKGLEFTYIVPLNDNLNVRITYMYRPMYKFQEKERYCKLAYRYTHKWRLVNEDAL